MDDCGKCCMRERIMSQMKRVIAFACKKMIRDGMYTTTRVKKEIVITLFRNKYVL